MTTLLSHSTVSQTFPQPQFPCLEVLLVNSFICDHGGLFCEIFQKIHLGFRGVQVIKNHYNVIYVIKLYNYMASRRVMDLKHNLN